MLQLLQNHPDPLASQGAALAVPIMLADRMLGSFVLTGLVGSVALAWFERIQHVNPGPIFTRKMALLAAEGFAVATAVHFVHPIFGALVPRHSVGPLLEGALIVAGATTFLALRALRTCVQEMYG